VSLSNVNGVLTFPHTGQPTGDSRPPHPCRRDVVENDEYAAFARRIVRAYARRVATGDVEALTDMVALSSGLDDAIGQAVTGLRSHGYSWAEIAARLGISRQAAQQRWGADT
jgi:DNA-directed RNA polymerase specialized sigma24 family protein